MSAALLFCPVPLIKNQGGGLTTWCYDLEFRLEYSHDLMQPCSNTCVEQLTTILVLSCNSHVVIDFEIHHALALQCPCFRFGFYVCSSVSVWFLLLDDSIVQDLSATLNHDPDDGLVRADMRRDDLEFA